MSLVPFLILSMGMSVWTYSTLQSIPREDKFSRFIGWSVFLLNVFAVILNLLVMTGALR